MSSSGIVLREHDITTAPSGKKQHVKIKLSLTKSVLVQIKAIHMLVRLKRILGDVVFFVHCLGFTAEYRHKTAEEDGAQRVPSENIKLEIRRRRRSRKSRSKRRRRSRRRRQSSGRLSHEDAEVS